MRYYLGPFFEPFLGWDVTTLTQKRFHKRIIHLKVPFTFDFHLSINIDTLNTNLAFFDTILGYDVTTAVKTAIFWESDLRNKTTHFKVPSDLDFDLSITLNTWYTILGFFLPNLDIMTSQKKYIIQNFEKLTQELDLINWNWIKSANVWKHSRFYFCLAAIYYFETVLKNLGKWRHKGAPVTNLSPSILKKICNCSVLKLVFSICTNFHNDWLKTWPDIRNLVFLLISNYTGNLPQFSKFIKDDVINEIQNLTTFDLDLTLTYGFFKKSYLWKVFHFKK